MHLEPDVTVNGGFIITARLKISLVVLVIPGTRLGTRVPPEDTMGYPGT